MHTFFKSIIFLYLAVPLQMLQAQLKLYDLPSGVFPEKSTVMRRQEADTLILPFWDDFSSSSGTPDPALWMNSQGVLVNKTHAIHMPTIGVATLDGATGNGGLYSIDPEAIGPGDSLVSKPINLGLLSTTEVNNVYLSFFWQYYGNQEKPDREDSLKLFFKNQRNEWVLIDVFSQEEVVSENEFQQVIYQVRPEFIHRNFQFKLEVITRLSGPFDSWHIDYVYLDKNRQVNDKTYFDRAISSGPSSFLKEYTAVPILHFIRDPARFLEKSNFDVYNLDNIFQPIEYTAVLYHTYDPGRIIEILEFNTELNPILQGLERRNVEIKTPDPDKMVDNPDSLYMTLKVHISSGDSISPEGINYRVNDTVHREFILHKYYAYDDGSAEFGLGLEQKGGKVACRFVSSQPDYLNRVDISFISIGRDVSNSPFNLYVWKNLSDNPADILVVRENQVVETINGFNHFQSIRLPDTFVADTFYIGWEQFSNDFLVAGFDKNNNTSGGIFYNVDGVWQQNNDLNGSLMIRPYFNSGDLPVGLGGESVKPVIKIYPNPASHILHVTGVQGHLEILDMSGRHIASLQAEFSGTSIGVAHFKPGLYLIRFIANGKPYSSKFYISR